MSSSFNPTESSGTRILDFSAYLTAIQNPLSASLAIPVIQSDDTLSQIPLSVSLALPIIQSDDAPSQKSLSASADSLESPDSLALLSSNRVATVVTSCFSLKLPKNLMPSLCQQSSFEEFQNLPQKVRKEKTLDPDWQRDRYNDITLDAKNCVRLTNKVIVHAAEVVVNPNNPLAKKAIMSQGPIASTTRDFFKMIFEKKVSVVCCLTQAIEKGTQKCFPYWDKSCSPISFDDEMISIKELPEKDGVIERKFALTLDGQSFSFTQLHVTWKDSNTPEYETFRIALERSLELENSNGGIILNHCSAGVGRTGVMTIAQAKMRGEIENLKLADLVVSLRVQRGSEYVVQTPQQYHFLAQVLNSAETK